LIYPFALFVTITGDIYVDNGYYNGRVDKWAMGTNYSVPVMYVSSQCFGLFVDINNILYCSMRDLYQVVAKSLNSVSNVTTIVAGTGCSGSTSYMLNEPHGIFVDINLDLYVADSYNHRIQLFRSEQLGGTTVAGDESSSTTISLNYPTGIILDANKYLFIVDSWNNRIVGSGPNGFRCLVGCSAGGSGSDQLVFPSALSFDSYGNMFVADWDNDRIQKFFLSTNSCGEYKSI
jgi:tripartite motif-containing protein 71